MKKVAKLLIAVVFCFVGLSYANASCNGNSYIVTDWDDVAAEFSWNCCIGDVIEVLDLSTGLTSTKVMNASIQGPNSSCAE